MTDTRTNWLVEELERRGVSRRDFIGFCGTLAASLALPKWAGAEMAEAVQSAEKPVLVWLEFQDCAGNSESFLRSGRPTVADIVLDVLAVEYHETIMAAAGHQAESHLEHIVEAYDGALPGGGRGLDPDRPRAASTARSADAPRCRSPRRSAATPRPPSPSAPARLSADCRRRRPTRPRHSASPTRCPPSTR